MTAQARHGHLPPRGIRCPEGPSGARDRVRRSAGGHGGLLRRRPHLARRGHLLRAVPGLAEGPGAPRHLRRRRLDAGLRRQDLPPPGVQRGAHAVRPARRLQHQRHRGPPARARVGRHPPGAGVPERHARPHGLARQGDPGAAASASTTSTSPSCRSGRTAASTASGWSTGGTARGAAGRSTELKDLGLKTFWLPLKPGRRRGRQADRLQQPRHVPGVGGHRGERPPGGAPHRRGSAGLAVPGQRHPRRHGAQRGAVPRDVRPLRLRRDPRPAPRPHASGWFEGGINWVPAAIQDAEHLYASLQHMADHELEHDVAHYWRPPHVRVVHGRPARARADRPDRRRPGDVVVGLPAQREHLRLLGAVAGQPWSRPSAPRTRSRSSARTSRPSSASTR